MEFTPKVPFLAALLLATAAFADAPTTAPAEGDWRQDPTVAKWPAADVEQVGKNKFLVTDESFEQSFTPYFDCYLPTFVTSDSILNGYHVLFEESVRHLESAQAVRLPKLLRSVWNDLETIDKSLKGDAALAAAARTRARIFVGTALKLLGDEKLTADAPTLGNIDEQVKKIVEAKNGAKLEKPAWLGPPDPGFEGIDYSRFKPRGFYVKSPRLQAYFRAVAWLQAIPFRIDKDEELLSALMLGNTVTYSRHANLEMMIFLTAYEQLLGVGDDWDISVAAREAQNELQLELPDGLKPIRKLLHDQAAEHRRGLPEINDQLRLPATPDRPLELTIRFLTAARTPEAVMFQRTTGLDRPYPSGLEVAALLGSTSAGKQLDATNKAAILKTIDDLKPLIPDDADRSSGSLYVDYLHCLAALFEPPERDAPPMFGSEAWQAKSCQTALGGWAQLRHTWVLQAKENVMVLGLTRQSAGFVEPVPDFYSRLAGLVENSESLLDDAGAFAADPTSTAESLRTAADLLDKLDASDEGLKGLDKLHGDEQTNIYLAYRVASALVNIPRTDTKSALAAIKSTAPKLRALADDLEKGVPPPGNVRDALNDPDDDLRPQWRGLARLSRRLEALAHKQLRGVAFNGEESRFLASYGAELASVMLYRGNSYEIPNDDAPRVADVFFNPNKNKAIEVGVGRPRAIYVLYPWQGREVLCRGAVMPYYEFTSDRRLNDAEWKTLLDSPQSPALPAWERTIFSTAGRESSHLPVKGH